MSKQPTYFSTFKTACRNGRSPWQCVQTIAQKKRCTETQIWSQLCKAKLAFSKSINGKKCYFPVNFHKGNSKTWNQTQYNFCWWAIEYCLQHGWCTPEQIYCWTPNQICWFVANCISNNYKKPKNFNPNKKVNGFPGTWMTTTTTTTTTKNKKSKVRKGTKKRRVTKASSTKRTTGKKGTTPKVRKNTSSRKTSTPRSYKFTTASRTTTGRRYRRAA